MPLVRTQCREVPENGHTLLMMEPKPGHRTFSDYTNLIICLDTISELYEQHRINNGKDRDGYTLNDLMMWLDQFETIEVFVYDKEISRYKQNSLPELKRVFVNQLSKLQ